MQLTKLIAASGNEGKIKEIVKIFKGVEIIPMHQAGFEGEIEENGQSFRENAYIKAKAVCDKLGLPALADDSGLCVDFLGGAPGIYSARFSGEGDAANRKLLLEKMHGVTDRRAHFECAVCLCLPDGGKLFGSVTNGDIADALAAMGYKIDKKKIEPLEAIKTLGQHQVQLKLYPKIQAQITVEVKDESQR